MALAPDVKLALENIVGKRHVRDEEHVLTAYSRDMTEVPATKPDMVVLPGSAEEVSAVMKLATAKKIPVTPKNKTTLGGGVGLSKGGISLDLARMDRILSIDEESMTVTAEGGCGVYKIIQEINRRGLDLPVRPWFGGGPSVGSWVAASGTGGRCLRYGESRVWVTGLEVVLPTGEIVQTGASAYENCGNYKGNSVSGNLDLMFHGSFGALGVITQGTVAMIPMPETTDHVCFGFDDMETLSRACYAVHRADVATDIEHGDDDLFNHFLRQDMPYPLMLTVTCQGYKDEVKCKIDIASRILEAAGGHPLPNKYGKLTWDNAASFDFISARYGLYSMFSGASPYSTYPKFYHIIKDTCKKYNIKNAWSAWSCFPCWVVGWAVACYDPATQLQDVAMCKFEMMKRMVELPDFSRNALKDPYAGLLGRIKDMVDPSGIMNPSASLAFLGTGINQLKKMPMPTAGR